MNHQTMFVRKALLLLLVLLPMMAIAQLPIQTNLLTGYVGDYGVAPQAGINCTLTLVSPNPRTFNQTFITIAPMTVQSDTNGYFAFTNILWGNYLLSIQGQSYNEIFKIQVQTTTTNTTPLASLGRTFNPSWPNPQTNYYTMPQIDALLSALGTNTGALPLPPQDLRSTNSVAAGLFPQVDATGTNFAWVPGVSSGPYVNYSGGSGTNNNLYNPIIYGKSPFTDALVPYTGPNIPGFEFNVGSPTATDVLDVLTNQIYGRVPFVGTFTGNAALLTNYSTTNLVGIIQTNSVRGAPTSGYVPAIQSDGYLTWVAQTGGGSGVTNNQVLPGIPSTTNGTFAGTFTGNGHAITNTTLVTINASDYGVVGDGVTDSTTAFTNAWAAWVNLPFGGELLLPTGYILLSKAFEFNPAAIVTNNYPWLLKGMDGTVLQLTSANLTTNYWFRSDGIMPHIEGVQFLGMGIGTLGSGAISGKQITGWAHNGPSGDLKVDADFYGFSGYGFLSFDAFNADLRIYAAHCNIGVGMGYKSDSWRGTIVSRFGNTALEVGVKMTSDFTNSSHPTLSGYGNCSGDNLIIGGEGNTNAFVIVGGGANSLILHGYCEGPYYDNHAPFLQVGHTDQGLGDTAACTITLDNVSIHSWASTTNMIDVWEPAYIKLEGCDFEPAAPWSLACGQGGTTAWGIILDRALLGWSTNYNSGKSQGILATPSSSLLFTTNDGRYTIASANQIPFFQHYSHGGVAKTLGQYSGFTYPLFSAQYWDDISLEANPRSSMTFSSGGFGTPATLVLSNANLSVSNAFVAGITTTNGETNLSWTASTVLMADANRGSKSIPNAAGWLHNDGAGNVTYSTPSGGTGLPGTNQIAVYGSAANVNGFGSFGTIDLAVSNATGSATFTGGNQTNSGSLSIGGTFAGNANAYFSAQLTAAGITNNGVGATGIVGTDSHGYEKKVALSGLTYDGTTLTASGSYYGPFTNLTDWSSLTITDASGNSLTWTNGTLTADTITTSNFNVTGNFYTGKTNVFILGTDGNSQLITNGLTAGANITLSYAQNASGGTNVTIASTAGGSAVVFTNATVAYGDLHQTNGFGAFVGLDIVISNNLGSAVFVGGNQTNTGTLKALAFVGSGYLTNLTTFGSTNYGDKYETNALVVNSGGVTTSNNLGSVFSTGGNTTNTGTIKAAAFVGTGTSTLTNLDVYTPKNALLMDSSFHQVYDLSATPILAEDWSLHALYDNSGVLSLSYGARYLYDSAGSQIGSWNSGFLFQGDKYNTNAVSIASGGTTISNALGSAFFYGGNQTNTGVITAAGFYGNGGGLTNLNAGVLTGYVHTVTYDLSSAWPGDTLPATWSTNTPGPYSTNLQSAGPSFKAYAISVSGTNNLLLQCDVPEYYGGGAVTAAVCVVSGTNANITGAHDITNVFALSGAVYGTALGTAQVMTNNLALGTGTISTNWAWPNGITIAGTVTKSQPVIFQLQSWGGSPYWTSTNNEWAISLKVTWPLTNAQYNTISVP